MASKRWLAASLLSCATLLIACGEAENEGEDGATSGDRTPLEVSWRGTGDTDMVRDYLQEFSESFEEEQDELEIVLAPITASEGDYFARVALSMQSPDTAPEIVSQDTFMVSSDANAGYLLNLDDYVAEWDEWDQFPETVKEGVLGEDGSVYAIPATTDTRGVWYNKAVFEEAGLPEDWQPESWEDILEAAEAILDSEAAQVPLSFNVATVNGEAVTMQTFQQLLYGTGETMYDEETEQWNVNGEGILEALTFIDEVFNQRGLGPSLSIAINQNYSSVIMEEMFPNGEVGMVLDGSWNMALYIEGGPAEMEDPEAEIGFAMMPTNEGQDPGFITMAGGWSWAIPANSNHHEESWQAIQAMSTEESQTARVLAEGNITVRDDSAENEEYINRPFIETATDALEFAHFRPKHDLYPNISIFVQDAVEAVATGSLTPQEAADQYRQQVTELVGEENTY